MKIYTYVTYWSQLWLWMAFIVNDLLWMAFDCELLLVDEKKRKGWQNEIWWCLWVETLTLCWVEGVLESKMGRGGRDNMWMCVFFFLWQEREKNEWLLCLFALCGWIYILWD